MIKGHDAIRQAYRDETVAREYVDTRFREPLGALLHARQVAAVRRLIGAKTLDYGARFPRFPREIRVKKERSP